MKNRRKHPRKTLIHHLSVTDPETGETIGFLDNISLGGMLTLSQDQMPVLPGESKAVELQLPTDTSDGGAIPLTLNHTWHEKDENAGLHATGFEFVSTEVPTLKQINALMGELGSNIDDE